MRLKTNRLLVSYAALLIGFGFVLTSARASAQPNIVFIIADDLGFSDTSNTATTMGNPSDFYETPTLELLASQGMAFTNAYAGQACTSSRAAILTGQYASRTTNHVFQNPNASGTDPTLPLAPAPQGITGHDGKIPIESITYAETLQSAGYETAHFGKFHVVHPPNHLAFPAPIPGLTDHGFDENFGGNQNGSWTQYHALLDEGAWTFDGQIGPGLDPYAGPYTQEYVDNNIVPFSNLSQSEVDVLVGTPKHVTDAMVDAAIAFMTARNRELGPPATNNVPFLVQYSAYAVHTPTGQGEARLDLLTKYNRKTATQQPSHAAFGAMIEGLDQSVARLIDFLETTQDVSNPGQMLAANTLVVFYSDNGGLLVDPAYDPGSSESPMDGPRRSNNGPLKGQKGELDEGGVRVPLIVWSGNEALVDDGVVGPGATGTINHTPVMPIDFYKTFSSLAGATLPVGYELDGEDLSGIFADAGGSLGRESIFWHVPGYVIDDKLPGVTVPGDISKRDQRPQSVIRKEDLVNQKSWKLYYNYEDTSLELYELVADPGETTNLSSSNIQKVDELSLDLIEWLDAIDAPLATLRAGHTFVLPHEIGEIYVAGRRLPPGYLDTFTVAAGDEVPFVRKLPDADGDGVPNDTDVCPLVYDPLQLNDEVGSNPALGNACDIACDNGWDDDGDGLIDFGRDPQCTFPWTDTERSGDASCGLGFELGLALAPLMWFKFGRRRFPRRA